ncbi:hypothetical protein CARUB_v10006397mg [Capsella rubella]|uniref:DUF577 domain-containing protein n=1 Tax=Capsella rubella TaxID=81985 RepID=R0GW43_9BRAS|nr:uncharacterized protein LOC17878359 isoform X1 [Capsella rubella]EOA15388.1 hypothetical protein CARUB_v10006397mg [Capsella rubella]
MAESLMSLQLKARDIIVSPSHEDLAMVVDHLFKHQDSEQYKTARALYDFLVSYFPDCLTLKLLQVFQCSSNGVTRFRSIYQLSETLTDLRYRNFKLSLDALYEIKPVVISCLTRKETKESDIKILRRIVCVVAYNVVTLHNGKWDELSDCILTLASSHEPVKAFHVFVDLPLVYEEFIERFLNTILQKADNVFLDLYRVGDWSLAIQTLVKMWIQISNTSMTIKAIRELMVPQLAYVVNSVFELVNNEKEHFLVRGLEDFKRFFSRDMSLYHYNENQCHFVVASMNEIEGVVVGTKTKEIVRKIKMLVTEQQSDDVWNPRQEFDRVWYDHLKNLSSLQVLKIFASTDLEDRSREIAIRRLNVLLSGYSSKKVQINIAEMRQIQTLVMSCLHEERISDSMFKVLGEVVNHVAYEVLINQDEIWYELRDYIASSKTEFQRAVYIFQCLTMALVEDDFVISIIEKLFPKIITRLDPPPTELLVDNSCWVWAFTGAFCAAVHLIEIPSCAETVKEIAHNMIDSVRKLVERDMEVGFVRRAFRDVERILCKQLEWYSTSQYKLLKGLLWRLYVIKGMKWESKIVLWRINVIVERRVREVEKELPKNEFDLA